MSRHGVSNADLTDFFGEATSYEKLCVSYELQVTSYEKLCVSYELQVTSYENVG